MRGRFECHSSDSLCALGLIKHDPIYPEGGYIVCKGANCDKGERKKVFNYQQEEEMETLPGTRRRHGKSFLPPPAFN